MRTGLDGQDGRGGRDRTDGEDGTDGLFFALAVSEYGGTRIGPMHAARSPARTGMSPLLPDLSLLGSFTSSTGTLALRQNCT